MLDFPNPPLTIGQTFNSGSGAIYVWDGVAWSIATSVSPPRAWELITAQNMTTAATQIVVTGLDAFRDIRCSFIATNAVTAAAFYWQLSEDGGATFANGATEYQYEQMVCAGAAVSAINTTAGAAAFGLCNGAPISGPAGIWGELTMNAFNQAAATRLSWLGGYLTGGTLVTTSQHGICTRTNPANALKFYSGNTFTCRLIVEGVRG
jgi:hypothetical protein